MQQDRTPRERIEAVVREVFTASDKAGIGRVGGWTAEEHIERTVEQMLADEESARRLLTAIGGE